MIVRSPAHHALLALGATVALLAGPPARAHAEPSYADVLPRVRALVSRGRTAVAIFDLDGTLLDPAARTRDILVHALEGPGAMVTPERPALAESIRSLPLSQYADAPETTLARAGIVDTAMVRALKVRWTQEFFTNRYLDDDQAIAGAVPYVDSLYAAGATIVYFSGRDARHMLAGTAQALLGRGFPVGVVRTQVVMSPDRRADEFAFKQGALGALAALGDVVAVYDNDPRILGMLHERFPQALAFFLEQPPTAHTGPLGPGIARHPDYTSFTPR